MVPGRRGGVGAGCGAFGAMHLEPAREPCHRRRRTGDRGTSGGLPTARELVLVPCVRAA